MYLVRFSKNASGLPNFVDERIPLSAGARLYGRVPLAPKPCTVDMLTACPPVDVATIDSLFIYQFATKQLLPET